VWAAGLLDNIRRSGSTPSLCLYEKLITVCIAKQELDDAIGESITGVHLPPLESIYLHLPRCSRLTLCAEERPHIILCFSLSLSLSF